MEIIFLVLVSLSNGNLDRLEILNLDGIREAKNMDCETFAASPSFTTYLVKKFPGPNQIRFACLGGQDLLGISEIVEKTEIAEIPGKKK